MFNSYDIFETLTLIRILVPDGVVEFLEMDPRPRSIYAGSGGGTPKDYHTSYAPTDVSLRKEKYSLSWAVPFRDVSSRVSSEICRFLRACYCAHCIRETRPSFVISLN